MKKIIAYMVSTALFVSCATKTDDNFDYNVDRFADIQILRYQVPGFEQLSLNQKLLIYYLSEAAIEGRDILYDQHGKYNLTIRRLLEAVYVNYDGDKNNDDFKKMEIYLKQVWMGSGIHHHYSEDKFSPEFSQDFLKNEILSLNDSLLPLRPGETKELFIQHVFPVIFNDSIYSKRTNQEQGADLILTSAVNFYEGVNQSEVEEFYAKMTNTNDPTPVSYGLNSKLVKENGKIVEKVYAENSLYGPAIKRINHWLHKALEYAENDQQKLVIKTLIDYNVSGDLKKFDEYAIHWVKDLNSQVDFVNGFTETYTDPLGMKATWESVVNFKNIEATKRTEIISNNAQWFEDNSPVDKQFKKEEVKGVSAKVITVAMLGGDCYPATPIGINLPNSNWIRTVHGSKSVTIENITDAYDKAAVGSGFREEFMWSKAEIENADKFSALTNNLHTDLHECLGHGSGKLLPGVSPDALKAYGSTIEEARADLFGLYYMGDPKMTELGLLSDKYAYKAEYYQFMMNGLMTQLTRIKPGKNIEESHMRNRQLIASWVMEKGKNERVVEFRKKDGKTYVVVNDYEKLRLLFGELLAEIQRIKSSGDLEAAARIVENYAVRVNPELHKEVLARYEKLNIAPYKGFVNPVYKLIKDDSGKIVDVEVTYKENYVEQNLRYSRDYSVLPHFN